MDAAFQIITAITGILALALIWFQLRQQTKQMMFEALTQLHHDLISPQIQKALRFIYSSDPAYLANPRYEHELEMIESVLNTYDLIGFRLKQGVLPRIATLETEWVVLLRIWSQVGTFIVAERQRRGDVRYKNNFEWLVKKAESYKAAHCPGFVPIIHRREFLIPYRNSKPCVGVLIVEDGKVLLVQRGIEPFKGYWDIPGGFLAYGEHPSDGAVREIQEETNLEIEKPQEILGMFMDVYGDEQFSTLNICYIGKKIRGELRVGSDASDASWFPLDKLPGEIAFTWEAEALRLLKSEAGP